MAVAAFATAVTLQVVRDRAYSREEAQNRAFLYVQSPAVLRRIALSFDALAADVYWIRALQHYGGDRLSRDGRERYRLLCSCTTSGPRPAATGGVNGTWNGPVATTTWSAS